MKIRVAKGGKEIIDIRQVRVICEGNLEMSDYSFICIAGEFICRNISS